MADSTARTTFLLRLRQASRETPTRYPVEITLDDAGTFAATLTFDPDALKATESDAFAYGTQLGRAILADTTLQRAFGQARGMASVVAVGLQVEAPTLQDLLWERLILPNGRDDEPFATSTSVTLFRRIPSENPAPGGREGAFRLLLLLSSPKELLNAPADSAMKSLDLSAEIASLRTAWDPLVRRGLMQVSVLGRLPDDLAAGLRADGYQVLARPATLDTLADEMSSVDSLHIISHGAFKNGHATLLLENPDGGAAAVSEEDFLGKLGDRSLRLVFLQACQSATREPGQPNVMSGLAPKLTGRAAAVIAMQDFVRVDDAQRFAQVFYGTLLSTGYADAAVNAGRRALFRVSGGNWAIPALYLAPRADPLWQPDAVLQSVQDLADQFRARPEAVNPFPIEVIRQFPGVSSKMETSPPGPRAMVREAVSLALFPEHGDRAPVVVLAGNYGRAKTAQLHALYVAYANQLSRGETRLPLFAYMSAFRHADDAPDALIANAVATTYKKHGIDLPAALVRRRLTQPCVLCLDGDQDADNRQRINAIRALKDLWRVNADASAVVALDEELLDQIPSLEATGDDKPIPILIVQLMSRATVAQYLCSLGDRGRPLLRSIQEANLFDLAGVPWLLAQLLRGTNRKGLSRSGVIDRVVNDNFAVANLPLGLQRLLQDAFGRMAWALQERRSVRLDGARLYEVLDQVRGRREVSLEQLKTAALQTKVLAPSDDDGVRFSYPGFQSYWCAQHLIATPGDGFSTRLDDITATLGLRSRVKLWEDTLVLLAGMSTPEPLIRRILTGSAMSHGEHAFLAARCINEAKLADRTVPDDLTDQTLDSLIWRSTPIKELSAAVRVHATECLGLLKHPASIPHLISLAGEPIRPTFNGRPTFELSGLRHAALQVLLTMQQEAEKYIESRATDPSATSRERVVRDLLETWRKGDRAGLVTLFETSTTDGLPAVVAFALGTLGGPENLDFLSDKILDPKAASDTQWSITDALLLFDPVEVTRRAIGKMRALPAVHTQAAYLIGKLRVATPDTEEAKFLLTCLQSASVQTRGQALKALAQLGETSYRQLCEWIACENWTQVTRSKMIAAPKKAWERMSLRINAIESLRHIGNLDSVTALRQARNWRPDGSSNDRLAAYLTQLSYEVSEDIYWGLQES